MRAKTHGGAGAAAGPKRLNSRRYREQSVLRKLRVLFSSAKKHFHAVEERCGVSGAQLWALIELRDHPGLRVSDLAALLSIHLSTASNMLDKLEKRGLVRRQRTSEDQRVVRIFLSPAGTRAVARAPRPARGVVPDAVSHLPDKTLAALDRTLHILMQKLKIRDRRAVMTPLSDI